MSSYGTRRDLVPLNKKAYDYDAADLTANLNDTLRNVMNNRTIQEKEMKMPKSAVIETVRPEFSDDGWRVADKENNIGKCFLLRQVIVMVLFRQSAPIKCLATLFWGINRLYLDFGACFFV